MIRFFDFLFALMGLIITAPITFIIFIICYLDTGFPVFRQYRMGKNKKKFMLVKFRTMHLNTRFDATHRINKESVTTTGRFLRKSKLDELPQLWNVLNGDMSLVGPRPSLLTQLDIIEAREKKLIYNVKPGITGLSQIKKIDMSTPELLALTDAQMLKEHEILRYFKYILLTFMGCGFGDRIRE